MPRSYHSPLRAAEAAATRERIVAAAAKLFVRDGYGVTSFKAIAAEAGVSVPTAQLHGSKHALLIAVFETGFAGDEGRHSLTERPHIAEIMAEPDTDAAIARYAQFLVDANSRTAAIVRVMTSAADSDPAARAAYAELEQRRQRDMRLAADWFAARGRITPAQVPVAADLLGHLTGADTYTYLVDARGWPAQRYTSWIIEQMSRLGRGVLFEQTA